MKLAYIVGARPQFIKLGPLEKRMRENFDSVIIHTGQHFDRNMSDRFFEDLGIPAPDYNLNIHSGRHGQQTGKMIVALEKVIELQKPEIAIVFGDTNSTLAGSIVCAKISIPTIHVEAGLRSFNKGMPEEINRIVADHVADFLFAPTMTAMDNLKTEGLAEKATITGDIMVDALMDNIEIAIQHSVFIQEKGLTPYDYYLLTLHRPYNVDDPYKLDKIIRQLSYLKKKVVFPIHPRTGIIIKNNRIRVPKNILFCEPLGYFDFIALEYHATKIITDSGGIQKEAYILKKPCITLRPETEWIETVNEGWNILVDVKSVDFVEKIENFTPTMEQHDFLGENVARKMTEQILKISSHLKNSRKRIIT